MLFSGKNCFTKRIYTMAKTKAPSDEYNSSSITVLEGLEPVRERPGMYIGSLSTKGLNHLIMAGFCSKITVILDKDGSATITDNGRGIPVDMHEKGVSAERIVLTTLHAGGKFDNNIYKNSGGLHGVGSSVVNALSKYMKVQVKRDGNIYEDTYECGKPTTELVDGLLPIVGKTNKTGTSITFIPDDTIFEKTYFKSEDIKLRLHETAYLNPELTIVFEDRRVDPAEKIEFHEPGGLVSFVEDINKGRETLHEVVSFKGSSDDIIVECAFQYINEFHEDVLGFCNNIYNAEGGTHITGFKTTYQ